MGSIIEADLSARELEAFHGDEQPHMQLFHDSRQEMLPAIAHRSAPGGSRQTAASLTKSQGQNGSPPASHPRRKVTEGSRQAMTPVPAATPGVTICRLLRSFIREARRNGLALELVTFSDAVLLSWRDHQCEFSADELMGATGVSLKSRERSILTLIGQGQSNKAIARELCISTETVKWNIKHIFRKLDVESRLQAVSKARSLGLLSVRQGVGTSRFAMEAPE
jgi:DNA-binding CsgD family transcriptional regulator